MDTKADLSCELLHQLQSRTDGGSCTAIATTVVAHQKGLTHSVLWNKALIPHSCAHTASRTRPSFHKLYFCCLGKHNQTETSFKNKLPAIEGRELCHFLLHCFDIQIRENMMG